MSTVSDHITILRSRHRRLAKFISADGAIQDFDSARTYDLISVPVADLAALGRLIERLLLRPDCAIVRGAIIDPSRATRVRRLVHLDRKTGECPTLAEAPHQWLALDMDTAERPAGLAAADLPGCAASAASGLPVAFQGVSCLVQASGSHGLKPGIRLRLWYWLDRSTSGPEINRWLRSAPVDRSVFRPAQITYTAAPVFAAGRSDHLPERMVMIAGKPVVPVPSAAALAPPAPRPAQPMPAPGAVGASRYAMAALSGAAARVCVKREGARHVAILGEARRLARFVAAGLLSDGDIRTTLIAAGEHVGKPAEEVDSIITWAMEHPSTTALPGGIF